MDDNESNSQSKEPDEMDWPENKNTTQDWVESELYNFRQEWQKELENAPKKPTITVEKVQQPTLETDFRRADSSEELGVDKEEYARGLFMKGIEMEKAGKLYEAIQFYKRAVQIVPDIEFKVDYKAKPKKSAETDDSSVNNSEEEGSDEENEKDSDSESEDILLHIQKKVAKTGVMFTTKYEQTAPHISSLPMEIILYILRWVVSSDLDLRSLELFGTTSRGCYLCARDPEIWRLACMRVWGCSPSPGTYSSWRNMFIERSRIQYNGCYISRTTYIRPGEHSFQDQYSRAWHLVAYYRYLRFFPEGKVLMLTSSEEPAQSVREMKSRNPRNNVMVGYYRMVDDKVLLVVQRHQESKTVQQTFTKKRGARKEIPDQTEQTFHMELQISNQNKRRHVKLIWTCYTVYTKNSRGHESTSKFDIIGNRFPPLFFSRVKSYTAESEQPLM